MVEFGLIPGSPLAAPRRLAVARSRGMFLGHHQAAVARRALQRCAVPQDCRGEAHGGGPHRVARVARVARNRWTGRVWLMFGCFWGNISSPKRERGLSWNGLFYICPTKLGVLDGESRGPFSWLLLVSGENCTGKHTYHTITHFEHGLLRGIVAVNQKLIEYNRLNLDRGFCLLSRNV